MKDLRKIVFFIVCLAIGVSSCTEDSTEEVISTDAVTAQQYDAEVVIEWYDLIKTLTRETEGYTPPVAARAFGYTGVALYEAVVNGMPNKASFSGKLNGLEIDLDFDENQEYHWPTVANSVLAEMTEAFYENTSDDRMQAIEALKDNFNESFEASLEEDTYNRSRRLGRAAAREILEYAESDGGDQAQFNNFPSDYSPPVGPQYWTPAPPEFTPALQPYWGSNRPFLTANVANTQPVAPPTFSTNANSLCFQRAREVYDVLQNITAEQIAIAEFWSDDPGTTATPPGHSISVLNQLLEENNSNLATAVEGFAKLGIGVSDAFISCWKTKYETVYPRPITYIRSYIDESFETVLPTPPFPEYTSGHSVQSGALAEIATALFGANYDFTDRTHEDRTDIDGTPRNFGSFYEMAEEAAISRLYGGIHYDEAIYLGLEQGYSIGRNVNALDITN